MAEAKCFKCGRDREQVKLLDGIFVGEIVKVCEECALIEDVPVIRKPTTEQLKESERPYSVRERLRRMAGLPDEKKEVKEIAKKITEITLDDLRKRKTRQEEVREKFELARKRNVPLNLVDNFNWHIMLARKKKKLTRKQLADSLAESETAIKMIENKEMPDDTLRLIKKLEQFFWIRLREEEDVEEKEVERIREAIKERLEKKPSKEIIKEQETEGKEKGEGDAILKFDSDTTKKITIAELQKIREEEIKKGKVEEAVWGRNKILEKEEKEEKKEEFESKEDEKLIDNEIEFED